MRFGLILAILLVLQVAAPTHNPAQGQSNWSVQQLQLTREELQELQQRFTLAAESPGFSKAFRDRARYEADLVRTRLNEGDFQVGDQVALVVEGEAALSDTFIVRAGPKLTLPQVGDVPLAGVLRSEVHDHLSQHLRQFIKDPVVQARSMFRVTISGAVGRPGYFVLPADLLISDAIMAAGGPGQGADLTALRVERGDRRIWDGEPLQEAIAEGRTIDQISLRAGDRIIVPAEVHSSRGSMLMGMVRALPAMVFAAAALAQVF